MFSLDLYKNNLKYLFQKGLIGEIPDVQDVSGLLRIANQTSLPLEHLLKRNLYKREEIRQRKIKMLIMDCDGVLTDGAMIFTKNQDEIKRFNAKDGQGIKQAHKEGIITGIISAGVSTGLVEKRAAMLHVKHVYVGNQPKLEVLSSWLRELNIDFSEIAYIGDDTTDIAILQKCGAAFCPADAVAAVKKVAEVVLSLKGGEGCVRELIEDYLLSDPLA